MIPTPKLPAAWIAVLGVIDVALVAVQPDLSSPWGAIDGVVLAVLTALGIGTTQAALRKHAAQVRAAARQELSR